MLGFWRRFYHAWLDYPLEQGSFIGRGKFKVESQIGVGSYGITYRCVDEITQQVVAVKQAKPSKKQVGQTMLAWEREVLSKMDHLFIPGVHDYFQENRSWWLVTDYVEGSTVEDLIFRDGYVFSQQEVVEWTLQLLDRVQHVHAKGFVHLDLRIPNIIIKEGELYLIDFGLAQALNDLPSANHASIEKTGPDSSKPLKPATIQSDLFDIGHFMLFMLYSQYTPEDDRKERSWSQELKLAPALQQVIHRLLGEQEPYRCSADLIEDLKDMLTGSELG